MRVGDFLAGVAERVRSRDDRVAQALAAAGVAALYGALFSAVALYDMISKVAAGGGAAALTAFAIGVSLRLSLPLGSTQAPSLRRCTTAICGRAPSRITMPPAA